MDYISRTDAIYAIKKAGGCIGIHDCFETRCGTCQINFALSAVNGLPAAGVEERKWINVKECLPNEDEMFYNGVSVSGERNLSDRVLALDKDGYIRCGYFMGSRNYHEYNGRGRITNEYTRVGQAGWEFGNRYNDDPQAWVVGTTLDIRYWMPLPPSPRDMMEATDE